MEWGGGNVDERSVDKKREDEKAREKGGEKRMANESSKQTRTNKSKQLIGPKLTWHTLKVTF